MYYNVIWIYFKNAVWLKFFPNLFLILDVKMNLFLYKLIENSAKIPLTILVTSFVVTGFFFILVVWGSG